MSAENTETYYPKSVQDWRNWLHANHLTAKSVWVIFYKKNTGKPTISWSQAVDEALCFGWIDSKKKPIDEEKFMQFFSKRKPQSTWSKINKDKIVTLTKQNRMYPAGYEIIDEAKKNGSWHILDTVEALLVPDDLEKVFELHPKAKQFYLALSKSKKKQILSWIALAKRAETRQKRIEEIVQAASEEKLPKSIN